MARIFVNTEELRTLASALRADSAEIGQINLQLVRAWAQGTPPPVELAWLGAQSSWVQGQVVGVAGDVFAAAGALDVQALQSELAEGGWRGILGDAFGSLDPRSVLTGISGWREWLVWGAGTAVVAGSSVVWLREELGRITRHSWGASGEVAWFERSGQFGAARGGGSGTIAFGRVAGSASASATLGAGGLALSAALAASADLFRADGELHATQHHGLATTTEKASGTAEVGAHAEGAARAKIDAKGVDVSGDVGAFAGAQASTRGDLGAKIGGVGARLGGDAGVEAGIGAKASGHATVKAGHVSVKAEVGVCVLVGAHVGVDWDIDVPKIHLPRPEF